MTNEQLTALGIEAKWLEPLNEVFDKYEINTPLRQAAFIGQCGHESNSFKVLLLAKSAPFEFSINLSNLVDHKNHPIYQLLF